VKTKRKEKRNSRQKQVWVSGSKRQKEMFEFGAGERPFEWQGHCREGACPGRRRGLKRTRTRKKCNWGKAISMHGVAQEKILTETSYFF